MKSVSHDDVSVVGIQSTEEGNTALALRCFQKIPDAEMSPLVCSYYALCLAREQKAFTPARELAKRALQVDHTDPLIYLNLGRIYLASGHEGKALEAFRCGLRWQRHPSLLRGIEILCTRRRMFFPFLKRTNNFNVLAGKIITRFL